VARAADLIVEVSSYGKERGAGIVVAEIAVTRAYGAASHGAVSTGRGVRQKRIPQRDGAAADADATAETRRVVAHGHVSHLGGADEDKDAATNVRF
jgi:hypothetical protein